MVRIGLCLFFLKTTLLFGQYAVKGVVSDKNGKALSGVEVEIKAFNYHATTDRNGEFTLEKINPKISTLVIAFTLVGYEPQSLFVANGMAKKIHQITLVKKSISLEEVSLNATRQKNNQSSSSMHTLEQENFGQDIPFLLDNAPSVVTTSDAGTGIGYTGIRVRGVDASRINVTINGIPVNDPESHDVYWVNMPDLASSVENIQLQRGVGTSTNGAAAFGASVNVKTRSLSKDAYAKIDQSLGSFSTWKSSILSGTGLLNNKFSLDLRLSKIGSQGYIDRASSNLSSYYLEANYLLRQSLLKAMFFSGKEKTYQSWYGTPESRVLGDSTEMAAYADRNYLDSSDRANLFDAGRTYNYYTYENETDNYQQDNYQLHFNHLFQNNWSFNVATHYTYGRGYYEQYRRDDALSNYGLSNVVIGLDTLENSDLIRRRWLDNHFIGGIYSLNGQLPKIKSTFILGGALNTYLGDHFGEVVWARFASDSEIRDRYYDNSARKTEWSNYLKIKSWISSKLSLELDAQMRSIQYSFLGIDEVNNEIKEIEQTVPFLFFNPKAALVYQMNISNLLYLNYGISNREPVRRDFRESTPANRPLHEQLQNMELGLNGKTKKWNYSANAYWMYYKNQLILTGQINDVGGYTRTNVPESYRLGIEMNSSYQLHKQVDFMASVSFSENKIAEFVEYLDDYDVGGQAQIIHQNTDLAFSPQMVSNLGIHFRPIQNVQIRWSTKYISRQFLDNTSSVNKSINPYSYSNLTLDYSLKSKYCKNIMLGLRINNLFNTMYSNNGYTFSYIYGGQRTTENFLYPQAGRNFMLRCLLEF